MTQEDPRAAPPPAPLGGGDDKVVLLVEDDEDARMALVDVLQESGYRVEAARHGAEGLAALRELDGRCQLILLDLMMPVMNGWDFRRKQRSIPALAKIPVLLMSAGARLAAEAGDLDAAGTITKPVEVSDLLEKVRRHLG
jgi:two-component system, chemotaxis family, chemotaxis protein CheY